MMRTYGVNTLISDSGVMKYRIIAERWDVNTVKRPSRWTFHKGIFFEQFDEKFHVLGYIQADTAYYYDQKQLWHLRGRVSLRNIDGMKFTSEELYWDQARHEFYSFQFSHVITPEREMQGSNFRSDERMTRYEVTNSVGNFERERTDQHEQEETPTDTTQYVPAQRNRQSATPKSPSSV